MSTPTTDMEFHELCLIFPTMEDAALEELAQDIKRNGLNHPIIEHEGKILDGRHRYLACLRAGVKPIFEAYRGDNPGAFVASENIYRRPGLSETQKAMALAAIAKASRGGQASRRGKVPMGTFNMKAEAKKAGISERTARRSTAVTERGVPELVEAVNRAEVSLRRADTIAKMPKEKQVEAMKQPAKPASAVSGGKLPKYIPSEGNWIADAAISQLEKILKNDTQLTEGLTKVINYCQHRIDPGAKF